MSIKDEVIIGKKGEILPKKQLREKAGFKPGDKVIIMAHPGELVIKKVYSIKELFNLPIIARGSAEEIEKEIEEEGLKQQELEENE